MINALSIHQRTAPAPCFQDAGQAWLWAATCLSGLALPPPPPAPQPQDIMRIVDRLYRQRRLFSDHLRVLAFYGRRRSPPQPQRRREQKAWAVWREAVAQIEPALCEQGIVRRSDMLTSPSFGCDSGL